MWSILQVLTVNATCSQINVLFKLNPLRINLGEVTKVVENNPHGYWGRYPIFTPDNKFHPQRTPWVTYRTTALPWPWIFIWPIIRNGFYLNKPHTMCIRAQKEVTFFTDCWVTTRNKKSFKHSVNYCQQNLNIMDTSSLEQSYLMRHHRLYFISHGFIEHGNKEWIKVSQQIF
jgi:hypothetical protein